LIGKLLHESLERAAELQQARAELQQAHAASAPDETAGGSA
jgi:hypothetical protein